MPMATLSAIIGTIVGYGLTSVIINMQGGSWQLSINSLVLICFISSFIAILFPNKFLDLNQVQKMKKRHEFEDNSPRKNKELP